MIIPSIDLMDGNAVQLVQGKKKVLDAGDPRPIAEKFGRVGEVAVVDLDAALGRGSNSAVMEELLALAPCRVGGGIRDAETAKAWLDRGATKVVLGTAARPEVLGELPPERVVVALDARHGEVVVEGWQKGTGSGVAERMRELDGLAGGYLVTFVEREGGLGGLDLDQVRELIDAAGDARLTVAGGVATASEIGAVDRLGADAQIGMALYTGKFRLADALAESLQSDREDGLWPTVVSDVHGTTLGLAWSDRESLDTAIERGVGAYRSRKRGLWVKGETSGATQTLHRVELDCDRDALHFVVGQEGDGFCHQSTWSCFGNASGLPALARKLAARRNDAPPGSYTRRLFEDPELLASKIREEADELVRAESREDVIHEAADVLYFTLARLAREGIGLDEVERALDRRALRISRRPGDAKPSPSSTEETSR